MGQEVQAHGLVNQASPNRIQGTTGPMANSDTRAALRYHQQTKHSYHSVRFGSHSLDWANRPEPFKVYSDVDHVPLPDQWQDSEFPALASLLPFGFSRQHGPIGPRPGGPCTPSLLLRRDHQAKALPRRGYPVSRGLLHGSSL